MLGRRRRGGQVLGGRLELLQAGWAKLSRLEEAEDEVTERWWRATRRPARLRRAGRGGKTRTWPKRLTVWSLATVRQ